MRIDIHGLPQKITLDTATAGGGIDFRELGGQFFSKILTLPAGRYAARVQIIFSEAAAGETITIVARRLSDGTVLDSLELSADPAKGASVDDLLLCFHVAEKQNIEIYGKTEAHCSTTLLRYITVIETQESEIDIENFYFKYEHQISISDLSCVILGTTAICNASCIHCPTNKDYRRGFPHGYMDFQLFSKIIMELRDGGYSGWFLFGLFGEPLEDRYFEQRLRLIKQLLPAAQISVATNCGVYDPEKHAFLLDFADTIGVHVEGISPQIYNRFMHPLKADKVFPKIISLLTADKSKKVHITTPVHKGNLAEVPNLRRFFDAYGAAAPHFTHLGNRSWDGGPWSELALAPVGGWCHPKELRTFVIDWDGAVLACCFDFAKAGKLGDLSRQSIDDVLRSDTWLEMSETHRTKSWSKKAACSRCRYDHATVVETMVHGLVATEDRTQKIPPSAFHLVKEVGRDEGGGNIRVGGAAADGIVIFGPYRRIAAGRYKVSHFIDVLKPGENGYLEIDAVANGTHRAATKSYHVKRPGPVELTLEFESDGSVSELRVTKIDVEFVHRGALLQQL